MLPFEHELSESLIAALGRVRARAPEALADLIADLDIELAPQAGALAVDATEMLRPGWPDGLDLLVLNDTLQRVLSPAVPKVPPAWMAKTMEIFALHYRLQNGVSAKKLWRRPKMKSPQRLLANHSCWPRNSCYVCGRGTGRP